MNIRPNPLLYGADEDFYSSFKLAITMRSPVDYTALVRAVRVAMNRYPYFCLSPERERESIVLTYNPRPVQVFSRGFSGDLTAFFRAIFRVYEKTVSKWYHRYHTKSAAFSCNLL